MKRVCSTFFKFVLQVSLNKIYQPSVQDSSFSCNMNISRNMYNNAFAADDSVRLWLTNYAESHLHDPSKGHTIILSVPSRKIVYEAYENDFKHRQFFYFPQRKGDDGALVYYLPSESWFMRCWRTDPALKPLF